MTKLAWFVASERGMDEKNLGCLPREEIFTYGIVRDGFGARFG
jgi:hypothetical protein